MGKFAGFNKVKLSRPTKSTFDLTHDKRVTAKPGILYPILITEAVPSDSFYGSSEMLVRLAPLLAPIYDQLRVYAHFYFVPNRLLWEDWEKFITGGRLGVGIDPVTAPVPPSVGADTVGQDSLYNSNSSLFAYLGGPQFPLAGEVAADYAGITLDMMPFAAYQIVWYNYYRDRNFIEDDDPNEVTFPMHSGSYDADSNLSQYLILRPRLYSHDYFTSALPFTQRGEEVLIPVEGSVTYLDESLIKHSDDGSLETAAAYLGHSDADDPGVLGSFYGMSVPPPGAAINTVRIENIDTISNVSTTINDFRTAYALQVWLERNAVAGSRYTESNQAHFGVRPQDSRLQRPEYIGGGMIPVKISEVVSTAWSTNDADDAVPLANLGGRGITYGDTNTFKYFCVEHGFIIGLLSIMPNASYQQGLPRMFQRRSFLDYPWPTFAKLGEQPVHKWEIYFSALNMTPENGEFPLFAYQSRYGDWKYVCDTNAGGFRDDYLFWTFTRIFTDSPEQGIDFLMVNDPINPASAVDRVFAVSPAIADPFLLYIHNKLKVKRPLPYFGTPNTLGFV